MFRRLGMALGSVVVLYHGWLLGRWLVACVIVVGLSCVRRAVVLRGGRSVAALWILAALLHAPVAVDAAAGLNALALPDVAAAVVRVVVQCAIAGLGVVLVACARRARRKPSRDSLARAVEGRAAARVSPGFVPAWSARPPPVS